MKIIHAPKHTQQPIKMHILSVAKHRFGWLVVSDFNATLTAKVISWRSVTHMCFLAFSHQHLHYFSFQSHRLLFSHASAEVRGENTLERKVASTGDIGLDSADEGQNWDRVMFLVTTLERILTGLTLSQTAKYRLFQTKRVCRRQF